MRKFPNTVFRVAGYFPVAANTFGLAITILESLENEGHYFVQEISANKISNVVEVIDMLFVPMGDQSNKVVRVGDEAIYCFILPAAVGRRYLSKFEAVFGQKEEIRVLLEEGVKELDGEALLEAAFLLDDSDAILSVLDSRYFSMRSAHPQSAEFFRQNNILREMVVFRLTDQRLKVLARRCHINFSEIERSIRVTFPDSATLEDRKQLEHQFELQLGLSKSFSDPGTVIAFEERAYKESLDLGHYADLVKFDLPFSLEFLREEGAREIFVPIGLTRDVFDSIIESENPSGQISFEDFLQKTQVVLANRPAGVLLKQLSAARAFDAEIAIEIAAATMMVAHECALREWRAFGRVRCCTFAIRPWGQHPADSPDETQLYCIGAMRDIFSGVRQDIPFDIFFRVARKGVVMPENFVGTGFGLTNELTEFAVLVMHGLLSR